MHASDFDYHLPEHLIAQQPAAERSASRLLDCSSGELRDRGMREFPQLLRPGDLVIFNDTRVIPARLIGRKESGGRVELMVERVLEPRGLWTQIRASKSPHTGTCLLIDGIEDLRLQVRGRDDDIFHLELLGPGTAMELLERAGRLPLPPYIHHLPDAADAERYQTVFASAPGAVAAPTAGLHFDAALLSAIDAAGAARATLTLHVGAGTFQPLRVDDVTGHRMHAERYRLDEALVRQVEETRARGRRIVAVGTTVSRALESAALAARAADAPALLQSGEGETRLFITPGFHFQVVDLLLTNFHLPRSTLLMLVSAFAGQLPVMQTYAHAIAQGYRFFSYGDAMLLARKDPPQSGLS